jgi:glucan biosynthesis protein C
MSMTRGPVTDMNATKSPAMSARASGRRFELDWLRSLVVLGLIPYHAAVVFAVGPGDYVKSAQRSLVFDLAATLVSLFGMPLLFMVAGAATWFALGRRTPARYALERVERLAIPFIFGVLVLVPIQLYYGRRASSTYTLNYLQFYRDFLLDWAHIAQHGVFGLGFQYWGHLWFVLYLLAVSVFLLPLTLWLRGPAARRAIASVAAHDSSPLTLFLLVGAPLVGIEAALQGPIGALAYADYTSLYSGPAGLVLYAAAFALGYIIYSDARLQRAAVRYRILALAQALALIALHEGTLAVAGDHLTSALWGALLIRCLRGYITCCLLIAILGFAQRYLAMDGAVLRYLNEASYPVYILHMPILTVLGFYLVRWQVPIAATFALLLIATACLTFALYEGIVRRVPLARFLFGIKSPGGRTRGV